MSALPPAVMGEARFLPPAHVVGWCTRMDGGGPAMVEILLDGAPVAAMAATLPRGAMPLPGNPSARNGFVIALPSATLLATAQRIEARERGTGYVFARVLLRSELTRISLDARLAALSMRDVEAAVRPQRAAAASTRLGAALAALAPLLRGETPIEAELRRIRASLPRLALSETPDLSLIIAADTPEATRRRLIGVQPICDRLACEIILADSGGIGATLLATALPALRMMRVPSDQPASVALDALLAEARGERFCLCAGPETFDAEWPATPGVHLGGQTAPLAPAGVRRRVARHGFELMAPSALLREIGGFAGAAQMAVQALDETQPGICGAVADAATLFGLPVTAWHAPRPAS